MKKIILTTLFAMALATPALAIDFGNGLSLENTLHAEYSEQSAEFSSYFETQLNYDISASVSLYAQTHVDFSDVDFSGVNLGVDVTPTQLENVYLNAEVSLDKEFNYVDAVISAELKF